VPVILGADNPQCLVPEVQKKVSLFTLVLNLVTGILSGFVAPKFGHMSDRYGRKKLMAIASCGGVLAEIVTILAAKYPDVISYKWFILGSVFDGLTGSFTTGSLLGHSYTSDCTPPSKRGVSIGYLHAALFTGLAFGPLLAGYFVKWTGSLLSIFYVVLGCHIFYITYIILVLPESLSKKKQALARERYAQEQEAVSATSGSWIGSLITANPLAPLKILWPLGPGSSLKLRRNFLALSLIDMIILGAAMGSMTVILLYSKYTFGWGNFESSRFISLVSMVRVLVLMGIFPIVNYLVRIRPAARRRRESGITVMETNSGADELDVWLIRIALLSDVVGVTGYIFARSEALFVLSGCITAFGGLGSATIQAAITRHVPADRVGQLLGAIGLLHAFSRVLAPIMFNGLYAATVDTFPQAIFVLLSSIFILALLASLLVRPHGKTQFILVIAEHDADIIHSVFERSSRAEFAFA
jgi:MFS family permease